MSKESIFAILQKHDDGTFSVWYPEIPDDEVLLKALLEKYQNSGSSERGSSDEILQDIQENI